MDEEEAWRLNYQFIEIHYPKLYKKAFRFYLQKVHILIQEISKEQRQEFHQQYEYLKNILKKNLLFMTLRSGLNWKYRIKYLIDYILL